MTQWSLAGTYFETCNCKIACPCAFGGPPTEGDCTAVVAWHIDKGRYGDLALDGLNVALAVHAPGHMMQTKWKAAAYFDAAASDAQSEALQAIFSGQAGGHPAVLASFVDRMVGIRKVPMRYEGDGKRVSLAIPGITDAALEALEGADGEPITISNHPLCVAPGVPATVARSKHFTFLDFGLDWKLSDRNGFMSAFTYGSA
jgi:hypothetical protein